MPNTDPNLRPGLENVIFGENTMEVTVDSGLAMPRTFVFTHTSNGELLSISAYRMARNGDRVSVTGTFSAEETDAIISQLLYMRQRNHMEHCTANSCCLAQAYAREN